MDSKFIQNNQSWFDLLDFLRWIFISNTLIKSSFEYKLSYAACDQNE